MSAASDPTAKQSGIVTKADGTRSVAASVRADGSVRREIKIRPGYTPPEDVEKYRNRIAEGFRSRGKGGVLGAELVEDSNSKSKEQSAAANKNAKRREARKKAAAAAQSTPEGEEDANTSANGGADSKATELEGSGRAEGDGPKDEEAERAKEAKKLAKKLRQAKELKSKQQSGDALIPDQLAKIVKINELMRQLNALGFNEDGERKAKDGETKANIDDDGERELEET